MFNLEEDPHEMRDLSGDKQYNNELNRLRQTLIQELTPRPEGFVMNGELQVGVMQSSVIPRKSKEKENG